MEEYEVDEEGVKNGEYKSYYPSHQGGGVWEESNYKNGKLHGHYVEWQQNGGVYREINYVDGMRNGKFWQYFENANKGEPNRLAIIIMMKMKIQ